MGTLLLLAWYLILPLAVFGDWYLSFPLWDGWNTLSVLASTLLYFWLAGNLILAAKLPLLEGLVPYDRRVRLHILTGMGIVALAAWHAAGKFVGGVIIDTLSWTLLLGVSGFLLAAFLWTRVPALDWLRDRLGSGFRRLADRFYDPSRLLHGLASALILGLSWWHIHEAGIDAMGVLGLSPAWALAALGGLAAYLASWLRLALGFKGRVAALHRTPALTVLEIELERPLRFRAGQFAWLRFPGQAGLWSRHPYSLLDAPAEQGSRRVRFAVKPSGDFSAALAALRPGCAVRLHGPAGAFTPSAARPVLLIGTGSGVAPVLSLLDGPGRSAGDWRAILAVDSRAELPHHPAPGPASAELLVASEDRRRIDRSLLSQHLGDPRRREVWLCASPRLRRALVRELRALGVPRRRIHHESFGFG